MKKLLLVAVAACLFGGCAGSYPVTQQEQRFEKVYAFDSSFSKNMLYEKSLEWIAHSFVSAKSVIDHQDKDAGVIVGKGNVDVTYLGVTQNKPVSFTMEVDVKDGKVRIVFDDLSTATKTFVDQAHAKFENMCVNLKEYIDKGNQNW